MEKSSWNVGRVALVVLVCGILLALGAPRVNAASTCTFTSATASDTQHDWNTAGNWVCSGGVNAVPTSTTDVVIPAATSTQNTAAAYAGTLSVGVAANVTSSFALQVAASTTNNGIIYASAAVGFATSTFATTTNGGAIIISQPTTVWGGLVNSGTITNTRTMIVTRLWLNTGTYTGPTGTVNFTSSTPVTIPADLTFGQIGIFKDTGVAATLSGNVTSTNVVISTGTLVAGSNTMHVEGDWTDTGTFNGGTGSVIFDGGIVQTIYANGEPGFYLLTVTGTATELDLGDGTCAGSCAVTSASSTTIGTGASFNLHDENLFVGGNWTDDGTFVPGTGTVEFNGSVNQSIGAESSFKTLSINKSGGIAQLTGTVTSTGAVTITSGTFALGSHTLHVGGSWTDNGTLNGGTGTVDFNGASIQTIQTAEPNFYLLTINTRVGRGGEKTQLGDGFCFQACTVTVASSTTIAAGSTLEIFDETLNVGGNWTDNGTLSGGTGIVTLNGSGNQSVSTEPNFKKLTINKATGTALLLGDATTTATVTLSSGTFNLGGHTISVGSAAAGAWVNSGGTLVTGGGLVAFSSGGVVSGETNFTNVTMNGTTSYNIFGVFSGNTLTLGSDIAVSGTMLINSGRLRLGSYILTVSGSGTPFEIVGNGIDQGVFDPQTGTVKYTGTSPVVAPTTFYNLTMNGSGTSTLSSISTTTTNNFLISSGTVGLGSGTLHVGGNWTDNGTFDSGTGIVEFNGTANQNIGAEPHFYIVVMDGSARGVAYTLLGSVTTTRNFTITGFGILSLGSYTLSVGGNWSVDGTLQANTGTVVFNGSSQSISGSSSFNNLTKRVSAADTLTFTTGATQTVTGLLTLEGATSNLLSLRSSSSGTLWYIDPQGTDTIDHVNVQDSVNVRVAALDAGLASVSAGNNTNWLFDTTAPNAPTASPTAGTFTTTQSVTLSTNDGTATIRYTTDGSTPSCTVGNVYASAISVSATLTIRSIACDAVPNPSAVSVDTFTISAASTGGSSGGGGVGGSTYIPSTPTFQVSGQTTQSIQDARTNLANLSNVGLVVHNLIKLPDDGDPTSQYDSAVYYIGSDGKRHAFPNGKIYFTWYTNFDGVQVVNASTLASIPLGANVTYKPGVKMVKFTTDPKVYVVQKNGVLRWVTTEPIAIALYGLAWNRHVDDISDAFYSNYSFGASVNSSTDYSPTAAQAAVTYPSDNFAL